MKQLIIGIIALIFIAGGAYWYSQQSQGIATSDNTPSATTTPTATTTETAQQPRTSQTTIGTTVQGRSLMAYHFGSGPKEILFIGGIHGGYEWNTVLVAYELKKYLEAHPEAVPAGETVTVIPVLNPDGLNKVVGTTSPFLASAVPTADATIPGRFNGNTVDLNRNFDCDWKTKATWQNKSVSGGTAAFSEPESKAVRDYIAAHTPTAVIVWYSSAGGVFASNCHGTVLPETKALMTTYANASGYPAHESFDFYATTGDMVNWLAKSNIPAISVLLTNHTDIEWDKNLAGIQAVLKTYAQ